MRLSTSACLLALAVLVLFAPGCSPSVDLTKDIAVIDVTTGWFDAGIVVDAEGRKNKLVPTIAFRLKNKTTTTTISTVQLNAVYHEATDLQSEFGTSWVKGVGSEGLAPGATSQEFVLKGDLGHIGLQPRLEMLQNRDFKDFVVDLHAKAGAQQWVKLGRFKIQRQLLTH